MEPRTLEVDRESHSYLLGVTESRLASARAALQRLVRKSTDGRYYTSQHSDADVTEIVGSILEN